jgi:hypothetical protein
MAPPLEAEKNRCEPDIRQAFFKNIHDRVTDDARSSSPFEHALVLLSFKLR